MFEKTLPANKNCLKNLSGGLKLSEKTGFWIKTNKNRLKKQFFLGNGGRF